MHLDATLTPPGVVAMIHSTLDLETLDTPFVVATLDSTLDCYICVDMYNTPLCAASVQVVSVLVFQVNPGEHVIEQGDDGDNFYVIDS